MKMVAHETPGMNFPISLQAGFSCGLEEEFASLIVAEHGLAPVATIHDMVNGAWILQT